MYVGMSKLIATLTLQSATVTLSNARKNASIMIRSRTVILGTSLTAAS